MSDSEAEKQVALLLAANEADDLVEYLAKGRYLEHYSEAALSAVYVHAFRAWALAAGAKDQRGAVDDAGAEYQLRKTKPPHDLVAKEMNQITALLTKMMEELDEDGQAEMEKNIANRLNEIGGKKH